MDDGRESVLSDPGAFQRAVGNLIDVGQSVRAKELAMDFIAANPSHPSGHLALSRILRQQDENQAALEAAEAAIALHPDSEDGHLFRAFALTSLGRFAESEESIRRALQIDPNWAGAHATYANLLSYGDRNVEALQRAELALSLDPDLPWLHTLRARLLLYVHPRHWTISEDAVRTSLRLNPQSAQAHSILGLVLLRGAKNQEAEDAFREALRLDPADPLAIRGLSELVKGKSPFYRPMLWFGQMMSRLGQDGQLGVLFGLWALYETARAVVPPGNQAAMDLLTAVYFGFCAYTWFAGPITRALLRRSYPWLT
ncbi:MAG: tetratricopeptide repeat protein [Deltaproteobacteria bacterium]|nr:tetratricopeptide repeat protein [Deltaproteobacteria bacterium]